MARGGRKSAATGSHSIQSYLQPRDGECRSNKEIGAAEKKADENDGLVAFPKKRKTRSGTKSPRKEAGEGRVVSAVRSSKRIQEKRRKQNESMAEAEAEAGDENDSSESLQSTRDLRKEQKAVDEEYAKLTVGKPVHPFFLMHKLSEQSHGQSKLRAGSETLQVPSPPFHVTQIFEERNVELNWSPSFAKMTAPWTLDPELKCDRLTLTCQGGVSKLAVFSQGCLFTATPGPDQQLNEIANYLKSGAGLYEYPSLEDLKNKYESYRSRRSTSERSNNTSNLLWTDIYKPQSAQQICGNRVSVKELNDWLYSWKLKVQSERPELPLSETGTDVDSDSDSSFQNDYSSAGSGERGCGLQSVALLSGPVGCGKSAAVYACANEQGFDVLEINSSDVRTGAIIRHKVGEALASQSLDWSTPDLEAVDQAGPSCAQNRKMTMILFEEVDTLLDEDRGFMSTLAELAETAKRPIVLTSNKHKPFPHNRKLEQRKLQIKFVKPTMEEMVVHASMVCLSRGILGSPWTMMRIVHSSAQDLRRIMMLLQLCGQGGGVFQANQQHSGGCMLKDSVQLFSATTSSDASADQRNDPQAVWWFHSDAQFDLLPRFFSTGYSCSLSKTIAAKVSSAVQEAERAAMLVEANAAVEAEAERSPRKRRGRKRSSPAKEGETGSPCKSRPLRKKRLQKLSSFNQRLEQTVSVNCCSRQDGEAPPAEANFPSIQSPAKANSPAIQSPAEASSPPIQSPPAEANSAAEGNSPAVESCTQASTTRIPSPAAESSCPTECVEADVPAVVNCQTVQSGTEGSSLVVQSPAAEVNMTAAQSVAATEAVHLDVDPVKDLWLELRRGKGLIECDCKSTHENTLNVCHALAETADVLSSCDVISSYSLENLDVAPHLAQASLHHLSNQITSGTSLFEEKPSPSCHEQDLHRLNRQKFLDDELFHPKPKLARETMTKGGFTDYISFMARIVKLEEHMKSVGSMPKRKRSRGFQDDYFTERLVPEEGIQALRELFNFGS